MASRTIRAAGLLLVVVSLVAVIGGQWPAPSSTAATFVDVLDGEDGGARDALGEAGGALPSRTTVRNDAVPGVANLDAALRAALRRATADAAAGGITLYVDSGWRSPAYQEQLLEQAVEKYGSRAEAARWVATPTTSAHVSGDAVDVGHADGAAWLSAHGVAYGLCRIYANEPWHFELRAGAADRGCPAMYADAAHDPRMQGGDEPLTRPR